MKVREPTHKDFTINNHYFCRINNLLGITVDLTPRELVLSVSTGIILYQLTVEIEKRNTLDSRGGGQLHSIRCVSKASTMLRLYVIILHA